MRTLIIGQARSGTSALFLQLQAALPAQTRCLFEPHPFEIPLTGDVLVKSLVMSLPDDLHRSPVDASPFDRRLVLIRDPRDRVISVLLFLLQWHTVAYPPLWQCAPAGLEAIMRLLRQKEHESATVHVAQLFELVLWTRFGFTPRHARAMWRRLQTGFLRFHAMLPIHETIRYELLMLRAAPTPPLPRAYVSIQREGKAQQWRQWFTPEDCAYFRPLLLPYIQRYGYTDDWTLPAQQTIDPTYSSRYVETWVRVQRRGHHAALRA